MVLIQPSPHFNFQFLCTVETSELALRSWCYSIDCDRACVIKKKKREKFRENNRNWEYGRGRILTGSSNENLWSSVQPCRLRSKPRSFGYEKIPVSNFRIEFESFSTCSQSPKRKGYVINIDRPIYRGHMFVLSSLAQYQYCDKTLIYRKPDFMFFLSLPGWFVVSRQMEEITGHETIKRFPSIPFGRLAISTCSILRGEDAAARNYNLYRREKL